MRLFILLGLFTNIAATCGQKGPLSLPEKSLTEESLAKEIPAETPVPCLRILRCTLEANS